jgi:hypothetical protein
LPSPSPRPLPSPPAIVAVAVPATVAVSVTWRSSRDRRVARAQPADLTPRLCALERQERLATRHAR